MAAFLQQVLVFPGPVARADIRPTIESAFESAADRVYCETIRPTLTLVLLATWLKTAANTLLPT